MILKNDLLVALLKLPWTVSPSVMPLKKLLLLLLLKKRKGSHVQADWKKCQPPPGLEPGTSVYHDQRSNH